MKGFDKFKKKLNIEEEEDHILEEGLSLVENMIKDMMTNLQKTMNKNLFGDDEEYYDSTWRHAPKELPEHKE